MQVQFITLELDGITAVWDREAPAPERAARAAGVHLTADVARVFAHAATGDCPELTAAA